MAKGTGISGIFRGKKGDGVFYYLSNSNSSEKQGWRQYQPIVRNPKTYAQAFQRMKLTPMLETYRNLKNIIRRGFQGIPYGAPSLRRFEELNMALSTGFPYIQKGSRDIAPGAYQIAEGELPEIVITDFDLGDNHRAKTNLIVNPSQPRGTVGQVDQNLINNNTNIKDGDQLTFIFVITAEGAFYWRVTSVQLNVNDTTPFDVTTNNTWHGMPITWGQDNFLQFSLNLLEDELTAAAAVVQSREGNGVNLRSTSTIRLNMPVLSLWYDEDAYNRAIESYMASDSTRSDWPVEPIMGLNGSLVVTNVGSSATSPAGGARCLAWQGDDDFYILYIPAANNGKQLVGVDGVGLKSGEDPLLYVGSGVSTMEYDARMGHF